jgi:5-methylcytosine-specific restriction endonuclease McrA
MKTCSKCKETKSEFEFYKDKSKKDGLKHSCRSCEKARYEANKEQIKIRHKTYREEHKEQIKIRHKVWREKNKEKIAIGSKVYEKANKEKITARKKAYYKANKEQRALKAKASYEANKEQRFVSHKAYREANKRQVAATIKAWGKAHPERRLAVVHKRRASKLNSGGTFTNIHITTLLAAQNSKCVYCRVELTITGKGKYHVDHRIPLFLGGSNHPENLQLLCPSCNLSKGRKHPDVYEKEINYNRNKE